MSAAVRMSHVDKSYGVVKVLRDVTFEVPKGEVVAIIGQSGSGKSTALRCMNALERIQGGEIEVCGHKVHDPGLDKRALRRDVGMVFQHFNLFAHKPSRAPSPCSPRSCSSTRSPPPWTRS